MYTHKIFFLFKSPISITLILSSPFVFIRHTITQRRSDKNAYLTPPVYYLKCRVKFNYAPVFIKKSLYLISSRSQSSLKKKTTRAIKRKSRRSSIINGLSRSSCSAQKRKMTKPEVESERERLAERAKPLSDVGSSSRARARVSGS